MNVRICTKEELILNDLFYLGTCNQIEQTIFCLYSSEWSFWL